MGIKILLLLQFWGNVCNFDVTRFRDTSQRTNMSQSVANI